MSPKAAAFLLGLLLVATGAQDSPSAQQLTDVVWQYLSQLSTNVEETLRQAQQLVISQQFTEHLQAINPYTEEMREKLVQYVTQLRSQIAAEGEKIKEKIQLELQQLQTDITPFAEEVQKQVATTAQDLKTRLVPYAEQLQATTDALATQTSQKLVTLVQELQAQLKEKVADPAALAPYVQRLQETVSQQVADIKVQLGPFPAELKAQVDQALEELHRHLAPYAQTTSEQLRRQLEELSFQVGKSAEALREKLQGQAEQLQGRLDVLLQGELASHLDSLTGDVQQQIEQFRQQASSYGETFNTLVVEKVQELGQRLQPHASGVEDHLSFLEKEVKEKILAFTESLRQTEQRLLPAPEEA
ncbi:apolipoprotein A-IV-like [Erythrolamprus reginae]|uniref:apolipoprotein A-IV-like n=1 Tax=Erythrolamprus reginae TaxID=121349 RepID=UPI00396CC4C3